MHYGMHNIVGATVKFIWHTYIIDIRTYIHYEDLNNFFAIEGIHIPIPESARQSTPLPCWLNLKWESSIVMYVCMYEQYVLTICM